MEGIIITINKETLSDMIQCADKARIDRIQKNSFLSTGAT
jgi:hypothetical protein